MDLYVIDGKLKKGSDLSFKEVINLQNVDLHRWSTVHRVEDCHFSNYEIVLISLRIKAFNLLINSHYRN